VSSILVVTGAVTAGVGPSTEVAGLPLRRRVVLAARRAGFRCLREPGVADAAPDPDGRCRIVLLAGDVIPQPRWLRALLDVSIEPDTLYTDDGAMAMIESERGDEILALVDREATADDNMRRLRSRFPEVEHSFDTSGRFRLSSGHDVPAAEGWLFANLVKASESFMSRHVERRVSLAITRRLVATNVTPNAITLVSLAIGIAAAPFFLSTSAVIQLAGALLFLVHSIVDGCDGELARLKFLESPRGARLDFWGDNLVHVAVFACMGVGWSVDTRAAWPLAAAAVSIASTVAVAALLAGPTMRDVTAGAAASLTDRLVGALAHRDFIYLIVVLSALGKARWFLLLSATGTPLFLLAALARRGGGGASSPPHET
jgi:phosphatidylglycerophosphate synthase